MINRTNLRFFIKKKSLQLFFFFFSLILYNDEIFHDHVCNFIHFDAYISETRNILYTVSINYNLKKCVVKIKHTLFQLLFSLLYKHNINKHDFYNKCIWIYSAIKEGESNTIYCHFILKNEISLFMINLSDSFFFTKRLLEPIIDGKLTIARHVTIVYFYKCHIQNERYKSNCNRQRWKVKVPSKTAIEWYTINV